MMYRRADVKWREEGEGIIIFCPRRARIFKLNSTAAEIWKILEGKSPEEIAQIISQTYGITSEEATADVTTCLTDLQAKELVVEHN